jgi:TnsA endonuclease N terminal
MPHTGSYKGRFTPKNPQKYKGDVKNITYRSLWERRIMRFLDSHKNILAWMSEEIVIPYKSPIDGKMHRYFPDFLIKMLTKDGTTKVVMVEVKPYKETQIPKLPKSGRKTKNYLAEQVTYAINQTKWQAAREVCQKKRWEFKVMTENELFG